MLLTAAASALITSVIRAVEPAYRALHAGPLARRRSRTGYANPRVNRLRHRWGFAWHSYLCTKPNLDAWLADRRPIFPSVVQVQTINRCNAACEFCPYPTTVAHQPRRTMDAATWTKIVTECAAEPGLRTFVPMSKNEPLLDPLLDARIAEFDRVRQPHHIIELVTNGSALTPQRVRSLAASGLDLMSVSVNAADRATYERVVKKLSWERVTAHLDHLAQADLPTLNVYVRFTKDLTNRREARAFRRRWKQLNLFGFNVNNRGGALEGFERYHVRYSAAFEWLRRQAMQAVYPVCPYPFGLVHVLENGDVPFCLNDWGDHQVLGNVRDTSLRELYNSPQMNRLRELIVAGRYDEIDACRDCSFHHDFWRRGTRAAGTACPVSRPAPAGCRSSSPRRTTCRSA